MSNIEHLPYELTAEQLAKEKMERIWEVYGDDPRVIVAHLPLILQEYGHDCVEFGMAVADNFPTTGAVDIFEAFASGVEYGRNEHGGQA